MSLYVSAIFWVWYLLESGSWSWNGKSWNVGAVDAVLTTRVKLGSSRWK